MSKIKNITFLKAFLFEDSLPSIYNKISNDKNAVFDNKKPSDFNFKNQILKIKDVPDYLKIEASTKKVSIKKVKTLKGHLVELSDFQNLNDYLKHNFSAKSRSNFRRYENRLETCFNIKYVAYYGHIEKEEYNRLFIVLKDLLLRRFNEKQEKNYELQHLGEFQDVIYDMLLQKKASLFVIYHSNKPISIRINMHRNILSYYIISGYDIDYSKFHLGTIDMMKNIKWCINNNFEIYDLLKGYDYYKTKWATKSHYYYNHVAYNSNKANTLILGNYITFKEKIKYTFYSILKKYNLISKFKKAKKYIFGMRSTFSNNHVSLNISELKNKITSKVVKIDIEKNNEYAFLRKPIYDFLFLNNCALNSITIYKLVDFSNKFLIKSKDKNLVISVNGSK